jgi:phosphatidylserine/phosphatidylglycerophosphate/cardiolipin synthase-like enzyme
LGHTAPVSLFPLVDIGSPENNRAGESALLKLFLVSLRTFTKETPMKHVVLALLALAALAGGCKFKTGPLPPVEVYFSPKGGATEAVVRALDSAKQTVFVQAYSFTNKEIATALRDARRRGVVIHVILDKKDNLSDHFSAADFVANSGILVLLDGKHAIAHNKIMVIDSETVITGSFNFTNQAEDHNAENLLVIHDQGLAERYLANWHDHEAHSEPYTGRSEVVERPKNDRERRSKKRQGLLED